jgi:hypothetical protein
MLVVMLPGEVRQDVPPLVDPCSADGASRKVDGVELPGPPKMVLKRANPVSLYFDANSGKT